MAYYSGRHRLEGGGLGGVFNVLNRTLVPLIKPIIKEKTKRLAPKLLKTGIGLMKDVTLRKRNFKQAIKARGKKLLAEVLNSRDPRPSRHKGGGLRRVNSGLKSKQKAKKRRPCVVRSKGPHTDIFS